MEVEAVRILVPKAAITHNIPYKNAKVKSLGHHKGELLGQPEGGHRTQKGTVRGKEYIGKAQRTLKGDCYRTKKAFQISSEYSQR